MHVFSQFFTLIYPYTQRHSQTPKINTQCQTRYSFCHFYFILETAWKSMQWKVNAVFFSFSVYVTEVALWRTIETSKRCSEHVKELFGGIKYCVCNQHNTATASIVVALVIVDFFAAFTRCLSSVFVQKFSAFLRLVQSLWGDFCLGLHSCTALAQGPCSSPPFKVMWHQS